jgi:hypothetical protein
VFFEQQTGSLLAILGLEALTMAAKNEPKSDLTRLLFDLNYQKYMLAF